jgi:hypothetical protein
MPNDVEITITARDLSDPAFTGLLGKMAAVRAAAKGLQEDLGKIGMPDLNPAGLEASLIRLRSKIQSLGIADIADVNIQPGRIMVQLQLLKRLIQQAGISDILDVNLDNAKLEEQLARLHDITETIPVNFDVSKLPVLGIGRPIDINVGLSETDLAKLTTARMEFEALGRSVTDLGAAMKITSGETMQQQAALGMAWNEAIAYDKAIDNAQYDAILMNSALDKNNAKLGAALPLYDKGTAGWGRWGWAAGIATGKTQLFGGMLTAMGLPAILATAGGLHILIDAAIETAAVIIPAAIAFTAFGVAAAPVVGDIYNRMVAVFNVSRALNQAIYPMSGEFVQLANSVKPEVYLLFGDALEIMNSKTGEFTRLAVGAGQVVDTWGARLATALSGNGFGQFMSHAVQDLAGIGDVVGNIFGTIGYVLKTLPGYAEMLLGVLDDVSRGVEDISASPITQWVLRLGIAFHGAILWLGLAFTGAVMLGNGLLGLAARFGLASEAATAFDARAFAAGILQMADGIGAAALATVTFAGSEAIATGATDAWTGALAAMDAVNPMVWIGLAIIGLSALTIWLLKGTDQTNAFGRAWQNTIVNAPVSRIGIDIINYQTAAMAQLTAATNAQAKAQIPYQAMLDAGGRVAQAAGERLIGYSDAVNSSRADVAQANQDYNNYNVLLKAAGGNISLLNAAGLTSQQIMNASGYTLQQYVIEVKAAADAQKALALGVGRSAAALNAESNLYLTENIPALQQMTQAEDAVMNVILAGPQALVKFNNFLAQTAKAAQQAGTSLGGVGVNSNQLAQDFYTSLLPAAQGVIDALQQQGIATGKLTVAVADEVKQMLPFTKGNVEAKSVLIDLINNALGPNTVSLKTLDTWIQNNSSDLKGFNAIVADSTIKAGTLANVLQNQLNAQFHADLLMGSGADAMLKQYTQDLVQNTQNTSQGQSTRARLIKDLESTGLSAQQATQYVNGLGVSLGRIGTEKEVASIAVKARGTYTVTSTGVVQRAAAGGRLPGFGGGDIHPFLLESGEAVVDKDKTRQYAGILRMMGVPGMSSGGVTGSYSGGVPGVTPWLVSMDNATLHSLEAATARATAAAFKSTGTGIGVGAPMPGGGSPLANAHLFQKMFPMWASGANWDATNYVAMAESGWNQFADNPTSGAYGIPQALPFTKMPKAAWPSWAGGSSSPGTQDAWFGFYMANAYGGPRGAAAHEAAYHWYGDGVRGAVFNKPTMIGVGDGGPERVDVSPVGRGGATVVLELAHGAGDFDRFMAKWIKKYVRVKGSGEVQTAFGDG